MPNVPQIPDPDPRLMHSTGVLYDIRSYFLKKPEHPTLIQFNSNSEREDYSKRILQRLDIGVSDYTVLNIHKIGIEVPVRYVFEELLKWDGNSVFWPNHIARVDLLDKKLETIQIYPFGLKKITPWFSISPLFRMNSIRILHAPEISDQDNARYLLYKCSGGYPIGIFSLYVRSSISTLDENEQTQLFSIVSFNFYGKKEWFYSPLINSIWEGIHNRVTANVLNRIKKLCEWKFNTILGEL
jgi:hypothetical protein